MIPSDIRIGFVPIARPTFDLDLARELTAQVYTEVQAAGYSVTGGYKLKFWNIKASPGLQRDRLARPGHGWRGHRHTHRRVERR